MNFKEEMRLLESAFKAFLIGHITELRESVKNLICVPEAANYDLAINLGRYLEVNRDNMSQDQKFWGECVLAQLYLLATDQLETKKTILDAVHSSQNHFEAAYLIWQKLPNRDDKVLESLKNGYSKAEKRITGCMMIPG